VTTNAKLKDMKKIKLTQNKIVIVDIKFIEWFTGKDSPVSILYGNQAERFATTEKDYTIEELYQHWISEVK
jgi:ABC-type uncharacterized transport system involved in gliding motility auxiliary subunit